MKVKRITAMVLAALMTSATTSVAFAVQPGEVDDDQVSMLVPSEMTST